MNLSDLASVASIVSSAAVAVSLIYLGVQAHQNTKHTRALIQTGRVDRLMEQVIGYSDADKCAAYLAGNGQAATPEAIKQRQFMLLCLGQLGQMLDAFTQHKEGLLNDEQFNAVCVTYRAWLRDAGFREFSVRATTGVDTTIPKFAAYMSKMLAETSPQSGT
jgi:hypothetical protein